MARIITIDAVFTDRPSTRMRNGNAMIATAAIHSGLYFE
jgi:hypothetical protein